MELLVPLPSANHYTSVKPMEVLTTVKKDLTRHWLYGRYSDALKVLRGVPQDIVLELLVVVADEVPHDRRLGLLERLGFTLEDGDIMFLFDL